MRSIAVSPSAALEQTLPNLTQPHILLRSLSRELRRTGKQTLRFDDLVAIARGPTPDPIPNSAVKTLSADGTPSQDAGE